MMETTENLKELVWNQLVDYIESEELFFPFKIRQKISEDADETFNKFLELMIDKKMLVEFQKKSIFNRIAMWIFKRKIKDNANRDELMQIYVKGPAWEEFKGHSYAEVAGVAEAAENDKNNTNEIVH